MPGDYKQSEYGRVILPLVLLRRLDCVLEPTKAQVLATLADRLGRGPRHQPRVCSDPQIWARPG